MYLTEFFKKERASSENYIAFLLFLFPVGVVSLRHWASALYLLIAVSTLVIYSKDIKKYKPRYLCDKVFITILSFYFLAFILTSLVNGWDQDATYALGVEIKFLAIIPLYLILRQFQGSAPYYLVVGSLLGILTSFGVYLYEKIFVRGPFIDGPYGHLFIGPVTAIFAVFVITWIITHKESTRFRWTAGLICLLGIFPIIFSLARSAYLACIVSFLLITFLSVKGKYRYLLILLLGIISVSLYTGVGKVRQRVNVGISEVNNYFSAPNPALNPKGYGSLHTRFEMWRSARYFFRDHPIFGVGRFHYQREVKKYIDQKLIHPAAAAGSHPHNIFVEALIEEGAIGLIGLIGIIFWPLYLFIKYRGNPYSLIGILFLTNILIAGATESAPIVKDNFAALFMVFLVTILAAFMNHQESHKPIKGTAAPA